MKSTFAEFTITLPLGLAAALAVSLMVSGCAGDSGRSAPSARAEASASTEAPRRAAPSPQPEVRERQTQPVESPPAINAGTRETAEVRTPPVYERKPVRSRTLSPQPTQTAKADNSLEDLLLGSPSMSAQESASGSSIRGLSPISKTYATKQKIPDETVESLRAMEAFQVSPEELQRFLKEGQLH